MAKRTINWTSQALQDRLEILKYWIANNKSNSYSIKLNDLIIQAVELIAKMPQIGRKHKQTNTRIKVVRSYYIIYDFSDKEIDILTIWDSRQDPNKLKKKHKKL